MKRDELTRGLTQDDAAVEVHGEEHADVADSKRDPVKDGPDCVFLDARTVVESGQDGRQDPVATAQGLRLCSVEERGVLPAEAIDGAQGLAKRRCRKDRHQPKGIQAEASNGDDDSPERRRLGSLSLQSVLREVLKRRRLATVIRQADPAIIHAR